MNVTTQWVDGLCFLTTTGSGHSIVTDAGPAVGGKDRGARPMELLLAGMAGCSSIDVVQIAKKQRQNIVDCIAKVEAKRADAVPSVFTEIHIHFDVYGHDLSEAAVGKAVQLSADKYCSASIMLGKAATISHSFAIHAPQTSEPEA
ncbi:MAG: OsmC family protein [Neisseriaceae bacterium]|nr:OsmC family protein [Neisseriaceae bacterium]